MFDFGKREPYRNGKIRKSARGQQCQVRHPLHCNNNPETTVWAHSNYSSDGKGMGQKSDDIFGCYACSGCHRWLDELTDEYYTKYEMFHEAMKRSIRILLDLNILK